MASNQLSTLKKKSGVTEQVLSSSQKRYVGVLNPWTSEHDLCGDMVITEVIKVK